MPGGRPALQDQKQLTEQEGRSMLRPYKRKRTQPDWLCHKVGLGGPEDVEFFFHVGEVFPMGSGQVVGDDEGGFAMGGECYARINDVTTKRRNRPAVP
jgi:hypothetical protein